MTVKQQIGIIFIIFCVVWLYTWSYYFGEVASVDDWSIIPNAIISILGEIWLIDSTIKKFN